MAASSPAFDTLLARVRETAETVLADTAEEVDRQARWPTESMEALQQAGLNGLVVPVEAGGHGQGLKALTLVCEQLGQYCASTGLCFGMHCVGTACLAARATPRQREKWLEPIAAGEHLTSLALSEPRTGAHLYIPQTELMRTDDHYVLNGTKSFVTNGGHADSYVVSTVAAGNGTTIGEFSCVAVPDDAAGVERTTAWRGIGMRGNAATTIELSDVKLPLENLLGAEGEQIWYVFQVVLPYFIVAMSGTYLGIAERAFQEARQHLKQRSYGFGGKAPAKTSVVQRDLGRLWQQVEATRRLLYHAAENGDADDEDALLALISAKANVANTVVETVNEAMTLVGGKGFAENSVLGRCLRDARAADVMAPTTQMLETWTGRALLDLPLLSE